MPRAATWVEPVLLAAADVRGEPIPAPMGDPEVAIVIGCAVRTGANPERAGVKASSIDWKALEPEE